MSFNDFILYLLIVAILIVVGLLIFGIIKEETDKTYDKLLTVIIPSSNMFFRYAMVIIFICAVMAITGIVIEWIVNILLVLFFVLFLFNFYRAYMTLSVKDYDRKLIIKLKPTRLVITLVILTFLLLAVSLISI